MAYFVGMDVGKKLTAVCVMDAEGAVVERGEVETTPRALVAFLRGRGWRYRRIGMEAGDMASWLYAGLIKAKLPVLQIDPCHAHSVLSAQRHKTDRNDAQGIAELMRLGAYKGVHTKSRESQDQRALLVARQTLMVKRVDLDTVIRALLRSLGLKLPRYISQSFAARVRALGEASQARWLAVEPLLLARDALAEQIKVLERQIDSVAQAVPPSDDRARRRKADRPRLPLERGRPAAVCQIPQRRRPLRAYATGSPVRRDRQKGPHLEMGRRDGPQAALHGRHAHRRIGKKRAASLVGQPQDTHAAGQGGCRGRPKDSRDPASHVAGRDRLQRDARSARDGGRLGLRLSEG